MDEVGVGVDESRCVQKQPYEEKHSFSGNIYAQQYKHLQTYICVYVIKVCVCARENSCGQSKAMARMKDNSERVQCGTITRNQTKATKMCTRKERNHRKETDKQIHIGQVV